MSALLDSLCGTARLADCATHDASLTTADRALLSADRKMTAERRFWVSIGVKGQEPRRMYGCFAADAVSANIEAQDEALPGERIEVLPADSGAINVRATDPQTMDLDAMRRAGW